jgi:RHS repeat-associated protein
VGAHYEKDVTGNVATSYYSAGGQRIAMRVRANSTNVVYYLYSDHLGSASLTTDASGNRVGELRYKPYSETRYAIGAFPTDRRYTGQREEAGLGLYDYGARFYDPYINRWLSPDTIIPDPANPQSLNRYAYCLNNPTRYVDPDGHFAVIPVLIVVGIVALKAVDYGWTAYDIYQSGRVLGDPSASRGDKLMAGLNIALAAAFELGEPDDELPVGLPLDDVGRRAVMAGARETLEEGGEEALERLVRDTLGDQADDVLERMWRETGEGGAEGGIRLWPGPGTGRQTIDGITYSEHALEQMMPNGLGGRGIPPSAVQNALTYGTREATRDAGVVRVVYENVTVLWNEIDRVVVTVIRTGH